MLSRLAQYRRRNDAFEHPADSKLAPTQHTITEVRSVLASQIPQKARTNTEDASGDVAVHLRLALNRRHDATDITDSSALEQHHRQTIQFLHTQSPELPSHPENHRHNAPGSDIDIASPASTQSVLTGNYSASSLDSSEHEGFSVSESPMNASELIPRFVAPDFTTSLRRQRSQHSIRQRHGATRASHSRTESSSSTGRGAMEFSHLSNRIREITLQPQSTEGLGISGLTSSSCPSYEERPEPSQRAHIASRQGTIKPDVRQPPTTRSTQTSEILYTGPGQRAISAADTGAAAQCSSHEREMAAPMDLNNTGPLLIRLARDGSGAEEMMFGSSDIIAPAPLRQGDLEMLRALNLHHAEDGGQDEHSNHRVGRANPLSELMRRTSTDFAHGAAKAAATTKSKLVSSVQRRLSSDQVLPPSDTAPNDEIIARANVQSSHYRPNRRSSLPAEFAAPRLSSTPPAIVSAAQTSSLVSTNLESTLAETDCPRSGRSRSSSLLKLQSYSATPPIPEERSPGSAPSLIPSSVSRSSGRRSRQRSHESGTFNAFKAATVGPGDHFDAKEQPRRVPIRDEALLPAQAESGATALLESLTESDENSSAGHSSPQALKRQAVTQTTADAFESRKAKIPLEAEHGPDHDAQCPERTPSTPEHHVLSFPAATTVEHSGQAYIELVNGAEDSGSFFGSGKGFDSVSDRDDHKTLLRRGATIKASPVDTNSGSPSAALPPSSSYRTMAKRSLSALRQAFAGLSNPAQSPTSLLNSAAPATQLQRAMTMAVSGQNGGETNGLPSGSSYPGQGGDAAGGSSSGQAGRDGMRRNPPAGTGGNGGGAGGGGGGGGGRHPGGGGRGNTRRTQGSAEGSAVDTLFKKLELVGRGAYGAVYRGSHLPSGSAVALKIVNLDTPDDDVSDIQREVALLSQLREAEQKNVVRYWGCWLKGPELWIVMDYAEGGSVRTLMRAAPIAEQYAVVIVRETLVALSYLHKTGIIHRDIKAANILLTKQGKILLCDFGVAASLVSSASKRTTFVGTPYWMAPEVITTGKSYDQSADIWSLGITIYEMVTGNPPLADQEQMRAIMLIPKNKPPRLPTDKEFSLLMRDFVATCLNEEPKERLSADELMKTKWIKSSAKVNTSVLRDLIAAYTSWTKAGGMRMSLLGAEAADMDASQRDSFAFDSSLDGEGDWEFGTLRSQHHDFNEDAGEIDASNGAVIETPQRDHPLLRLFNPTGSPPDFTQSNFSASTDRGGDLLSNINAANFRPAPPPPSLAQAEQSRTDPALQPAETVRLQPQSSQVTARSNAAATSVPQQNAQAIADKASFTGTGVSPFRFGKPTPTVPPQAPRSPSKDAQRPENEARESGAKTPSVPDSPSRSSEKHILPATDVTPRRPVAKAEDEQATTTPFGPGFGPLSTSPAEHHTFHRRQQSSASAASSHSLGHMVPQHPAASSSPQSPMATDFTRPWMTSAASGRSRGSSHGSQTSDFSGVDGPISSSGHVAGLASRAPLTSSAGAAMVSSLTSANVAPQGGGWQPTQPSLLGPRGRSGSRSRAGPGSDLGMIPTPLPSYAARSAPFASGTILPPTAHSQMTRSQANGGYFGSEMSADLLPPSPFTSAPPGPLQMGGRARNGVTQVRASPLGGGSQSQGDLSVPQMIAHQRRNHGGSDPAVPSPKHSTFEGLNGAQVRAGISMSSSATLEAYTRSDHAVSGFGEATTLNPEYRRNEPGGEDSESGSDFSLRPLDLSRLRTKQDVYAELERTVDDLGSWLEALASSLTAVDPTGTSGAILEDNDHGGRTTVLQSAIPSTTATVTASSGVRGAA